MSNSMDNKKWAVLFLTAGLTGSSFFFIKLSVDSIPPLTLAACRSGIAAIILYGFMRISHKKLPEFGADWIVLFILGLLTAAIPYIGIGWGQILIDSSLGGILFATIPIFSVLIAPLILIEEHFTPERLVGAAVGFSGVVLIIGPQALNGFGDQILGASITLMAAFSYAIGAIYARKQTHLTPIIMATGQLTTATIMLSILSILFDSPWTLSPTAPAIISLIAVAVLSTAISVLLFFWLVKNAGATNTSLLAFFIPVSAVSLGVILLDEVLPWSAISGLGLIIVGAVIVSGNLRIRKKPLNNFYPESDVRKNEE